MGKNTQVIENLLRETVNVLKEGGGESEEIAQIAQAAEAYNTGKVELAANITAKGVSASASETLPELAEKVMTISQDVYEVSGAEMYERQLFANGNYWNIYDILYGFINGTIFAEDELGEPLLIQNLSGFVIGQYYRGYDSISFQVPFVVCEKWAGKNSYIYYPFGGTHTWTDSQNGYVDRWVLFPSNGTISFNDVGTCPRTIYVGKYIETLQSNVAGRIKQIIVPYTITQGGEIVALNKIGNIQITNTQQWNGDLCINNIEEHSANYILYNSSPTNCFVGVKKLISSDICYFYNNTNIGTISLSFGLAEIAGGKALHSVGTGSGVLTALSFVSFPNLKKISGGWAIYTVHNNAGHSLSALKQIEFPALEEVSGGGVINCIKSNYNGDLLGNLETLSFPALRTFSGGSILTHSWTNDNPAFKELKHLYFPVIETTNSNYTFETLRALQTFYIGYTNATGNSIVFKFSNCPQLTDIELKNGICKSIDISTATALTEENMYAHILQRLKQDEADCGDGVTITLGSTNLAKLTSAESVALLDSLTNTYGYTFA